MNNTGSRSFRVVALSTAALGCWFGASAPVVGSPHARAALLAAETCSAKGQVGTVGTVIGELQIKRGREVIRAQRGARVYKGDIVSTRSGQRASIAVCGGGSLYVNEKSAARMNSRTEIRVRQGEVAEQTAAKGTHRVRTKEAVAKAHGAYVDVQARRGASVFLVASGTVEVSNRQGAVQVAQDHETVVQSGHRPSPPVFVDAQSRVDWAGSLGKTWRVLTDQGVVEEPQRLMVDGQGNVYVTDVAATGGRVVKLSSSGQRLATWRLQGGTTSPSGITLDTQNTLYVTDESGATVQKVSTSGQVQAVFSLQSMALSGTVSPAGIAVDRAGNMYVADAAGDRLLKLSPSGQLLTTVGEAGSGPGQFQSPQGVALDSSGNLYVADELNDRVQKLSSTGQVLADWNTGDNSSPTDVTLDAKGNIYVAEANAERIQEFSSTGVVVWSWQSDPLGNRKASGQFDRPYGIAVDRQGSIYVADRFNGRIQVLARS